MIQALDSAQPPTPAQADAARAAGIQVWSGYLATRPGVNLAHAWSQADFEAAKRCGSKPIAYASGWDDPIYCKRLASAWGVLLCLDNESGIRPDGLWVQPWLNASGAGHYGNAWVHTGRIAAFDILAAYPTGGDPFGASWNSSPRPAGPCGWQWCGSHSAFGVTVDSTWLDPWFGGIMAADTAKQIDDLHAALVGNDGVIPNYRGAIDTIQAQITTVQKTLKNLPALGGLTAAQAAALAEAHDTVSIIAASPILKLK